MWKIVLRRHRSSSRVNVHFSNLSRRRDKKIYKFIRKIINFTLVSVISTYSRKLLLKSEYRILLYY